MMNIAVIILVLIGLVVHRYLSGFWEQGQLPYSMGFLFFANLFALVYLVSFIWMFGIIGGIITTLLCYFQIVYSAGLWVFSIPGLINMHKSLDNFQIPKVNPRSGSGCLDRVWRFISEALPLFPLSCIG